MSARSLAKRVAPKAQSGIARGACRVRQVLGRSAVRPAPWEADLLDDLAFRRPWNTVTRLRRRVAKRRASQLDRGVTLVIVNWNTLSVLQDTLRAVRRFTTDDVTIRVVDNGSTDGSSEWLAAQTWLEHMQLPMNVGHAVALDLALLSCATDTAVVLDSDAVPLRSDWIEIVVEPLRQRELVLFGSPSSRRFVHPMYMAVDVANFISRGLTFAVHELPSAAHHRVWGENSFDTAEWLSRMVESHELDFLPVTPNRVPDLPGMTVADAVYHHGGITRATETTDGLDAESYQIWQDALEALVPVEALSAEAT